MLILSKISKSKHIQVPTSLRWLPIKMNERIPKKRVEIKLCKSGKVDRGELTFSFPFSLLPYAEMYMSQNLWNALSSSTNHHKMYEA